jgi:RNA polymerase sigma-70 factor (ECF subfamily)
VAERETELDDLLRAANGGDEAAYRLFLQAAAVKLRPMVRRGLARAGRPDAECEDIVQETLLALHLKRHTWDQAQPLRPWLGAIAHHKLVDALRRGGFRQHLPLDEIEELAAPGDVAAEADHAIDADTLLQSLPERQRAIVAGMAMEGRSANDLGRQLGMSDGAVRVTLHRALRHLASLARR